MLDKLPNEILYLIFDYCDEKSIINILLVNKLFYNIIRGYKKYNEMKELYDLFQEFKELTIRKYNIGCLNGIIDTSIILNNNNNILKIQYEYSIIQVRKIYTFNLNYINYKKIWYRFKNNTNYDVNNLIKKINEIKGEIIELTQK